MPAGPADELVVQRPAVGLAVGPRLLVELADRPADLAQRGVRRQRRAERDRHRQRDPLGQPPVLHRAEDAGRGPVEVDGMIGTVRPLTIRSSPRWNGKRHPGPRDLALGKDADELAVVERAARLAERLEDHLRARRCWRSGSPASTAGTGPGADCRKYSA